MVSTIGFLTTLVCATISGSKATGYDNYPFKNHIKLYGLILANLFLFLFILMGSLNIFLLLQLRAKNRILGPHSYGFSREKLTLGLILLFFELSYLARYVWDKFGATQLANAEEWGIYCISFSTVLLFEGLSLLALLLFHLKNFSVERRPDP